MYNRSFSRLTSFNCVIGILIDIIFKIKRLLDIITNQLLLDHTGIISSFFVGPVIYKNSQPFEILKLNRIFTFADKPRFASVKCSYVFFYSFFELSYQQKYVFRDAVGEKFKHLLGASRPPPPPFP